MLIRLRERHREKIRCQIAAARTAMWTTNIPPKIGDVSVSITLSGYSVSGKPRSPQRAHTATSPHERASIYRNLNPSLDGSVFSASKYFLSIISALLGIVSDDGEPDGSLHTSRHSPHKGSGILRCYVLIISPSKSSLLDNSRHLRQTII